MDRPSHPVLRLFTARIPTPIGELFIAADEAGHLRVTDWTEHDGRTHRLLLRQYGKGGFTVEPAGVRQDAEDVNAARGAPDKREAQDAGASRDARELTSPLIRRLTSALSAYFAGDLAAIDALPVATFGTPFQREVWLALRQIPCGSTISYGELAQRIGRPKAVRAVGLANGSNPVGVVVPCHRVIGSNGSLTGYGGGIDRKRWLLAHERNHRLV